MFIYITGYMDSSVDSSQEYGTYIVKLERITNISTTLQNDSGKWYFIVETPEFTICSTPQDTREAAERRQVRLLILLNALELLYKRAKHADDISRLFVEMELPTDSGRETYRMELTSTVTLEI